MSSLGKAAAGFPRFFVQVLLGLAVAALTEIEVLILIIAAVILGLTLGPALVGIVLIVYVTLRTLGNSLSAVAKEINFLARVIRDNSR